MSNERFDLMTDEELLKYSLWVIKELHKHDDLYDNGADHLKNLYIEIALELYNRRENDERQPKILVD